MASLRQRKMALGDYVNYAVLALVSLVSVLPFVYVVMISLTDPATYVPLTFYLIPKKVSFATYRYLLATNSFMNALRSTIFVTVVGTTLNLVATFSMAYGLTRKAVPERRLIQGLIIVTLFFTAGIIPTYLVVRSLGLLNTYWSLIFGSMTNAWSLIVVRSFMQSIPADLENSARIDGCSDLGILFQIIIPLSMPAIAAFTLFFAVHRWNTYFDALIYISATRKWTLQLLIKQLVFDADAMGAGQSETDTAPPQETMRMAAIVLAMTPILIVYPLLQRHFAKGVMLGSIKG